MIDYLIEVLCKLELHWVVQWSEWKQHPDKKGYIFRWCENCGVKIQEKRLHNGS